MSDYRAAFFSATDQNYFKAMRHETSGAVHEISGIGGQRLDVGLDVGPAVKNGLTLG